MKVIIDIPEDMFEWFKNGEIIDEYDKSALKQVFRNGTPLDDVKAKIKKLRSHSARFRTSDGRVVYVDSQDILDVLDNIGSEVKPNEN